MLSCNPLTCITVLNLDMLLFVLFVILKLVFRVFFHQICDQNGLQQTEQHQSKNPNAVGCWKWDTCYQECLFKNLKLTVAQAEVRTYERSLVGHGGQDVIQDEQQDRDGQEHRDFEAQLLPSVVGDVERGEIQNEEKQDGQQEIDDVKEGSPLYGNLVNQTAQGKQCALIQAKSQFTPSLYT